MLRVGATVSMAARGANLPAVQLAGGWTVLDMPAHYARRVSASKGPVATLRAKVPMVRMNGRRYENRLLEHSPP